MQHLRSLIHLAFYLSPFLSPSLILLHLPHIHTLHLVWSVCWGGDLLPHGVSAVARRGARSTRSQGRTRTAMGRESCALLRGHAGDAFQRKGLGCLEGRSLVADGGTGAPAPRLNPQVVGLRF